MLQNKVALITGASRGIGREIALTFAKEGATVIVNYQGSKEKAEEVVAEIMENGGKAECVCCNVADFESCGLMIQDMIQKYGKLDILVNNAGITRDGLIMKMSEEDFDRVLSVNLKGAFNTIRHASRYFLKQRSGKIINISSMWGQMGGYCEVPYYTAKAALIGLTKALAKEVGPAGVRVNCVAPGVIQTDMMAGFDEDTCRQLAEETPLCRLGTPEDVAGAVSFLVSDDAAFVTGQVLAPNGGMVI